MNTTNHDAGHDTPGQTRPIDVDVTQTRTFTVTYTLPYDVHEAAYDILSIGAAYGIGYWASEPHVRRLEAGITYLSFVDDEGARTKAVTTGDIIESIWSIIEHGYPGAHPDSEYGSLKNWLLREDFLGHLDPGLADAIIQHAVFGEAIYG